MSHSEMSHRRSWIDDSLTNTSLALSTIFFLFGSCFEHFSSESLLRADAGLYMCLFSARCIFTKLLWVHIVPLLVTEKPREIPKYWIKKKKTWIHGSQYVANGCHERFNDWMMMFVVQTASWRGWIHYVCMFVFRWIKTGVTQIVFHLIPPK